MNFVDMRIKEKLFYNIELKTSNTEIMCEVELITGDTDNEAVKTLVSALNYIGYHGANHTASFIWSSIKQPWSRHTEIKIAIQTTNHILTIEINRIVNTVVFSYSGCDICMNGQEANVYNCIAYDKQGDVKNGDFWAIELCKTCLDKHTHWY